MKNYKSFIKGYSNEYLIKELTEAISIATSPALSPTFKLKSDQEKSIKHNYERMLDLREEILKRMEGYEVTK